MLTTVTTVTTATLFQTEALGAIAVATLIVLLIAKELLGAHENEEAENMSIREKTIREKSLLAPNLTLPPSLNEEIKNMHIKKRLLAPNLNMAVLPLLFCFALIVCTKVMEVL